MLTTVCSFTCFSVIKIEIRVFPGYSLASQRQFCQVEKKICIGRDKYCCGEYAQNSLC
jgi:hypothetical protein